MYRNNIEIWNKHNVSAEQMLQKAEQIPPTMYSFYVGEQFWGKKCIFNHKPWAYIFTTKIQHMKDTFNEISVPPCFHLN